MVQYASCISLCSSKLIGSEPPKTLKSGPRSKSPKKRSELAAAPRDLFGERGVLHLNLNSTLYGVPLVVRSRLKFAYDHRSSCLRSMAAGAAGKQIKNPTNTGNFQSD